MAGSPTTDFGLDQKAQDKQARKQAQRRAWEEMEERLTPRTRLEFFLHSFWTGLALVGFLAILSLVFDWADVGLWQVGSAFLGGFFVTAGAVEGQKLRRTMDEQERERHGFTLDEGRRASDGARPL